MRKRLSYPLLWSLLVALWLLLNQTAALPHVLFGAVVAFGAVVGYATLRPPRVRFRNPWVALELAFLVLADIVRSNIGVARIVLHAGARRETAGFLEIALELRSPAGLAALACIITATPGTSWARYDSNRRVLTMHILDLIDEQAWIQVIKERYERRLLEIFP